jgi:hypothetical protein
MEIVAFSAVDKARYFVNQAKSNPDDVNKIKLNLEVAIIYCRSVTFHLQSQFARTQGFDEWYEAKRLELGSSRLSRFLLEQRNIALKQGPLVMHRVVNVSVAVNISISTHVEVEVTRGAPWYKRSIKTLYEDSIAPVRKKIVSISHRLASLFEQKINKTDSVTVIDDLLYFSDDEWRNIPAVDLVEKQLNILEELVKEAQQLFSQE